MRYEEFTIEGRNAVIEAFRSGKPIDKVFILDGCQDGPMVTIRREAKKKDVMIKYVTKERLDQMSETGKHQGVIAYAAAYEYAEVSDILEKAKEKGEDPFIFILDNIEDPHNLGAIIRTANLAGAHGVIIPKNRAVGLTATVAKASAGALNYTPVAKVTNLSQTIEELKKERLCRGLKVSKLIGTEPYGVTDQDEFLNGALKMETLLTPHELLKLLHRIEQEAGRKRIRRWGPRTLDLDIIFYGDQIIEEDDLCVPHIDMQNREFVLGPMCEIAPHKRHPVLKETMTEMLVKLKGNH